MAAVISLPGAKTIFKSSPDPVIEPLTVNCLFLSQVLKERSRSYLVEFTHQVGLAADSDLVVVGDVLGQCHQV